MGSHIFPCRSGTAEGFERSHQHGTPCCAVDGGAAWSTEGSNPRSGKPRRYLPQIQRSLISQAYCGTMMVDFHNYTIACRRFTGKKIEMAWGFTDCDFARNTMPCCWRWVPQWPATCKQLLGGTVSNDLKMPVDTQVL